MKTPITLSLIAAISLSATLAAAGDHAAAAKAARDDIKAVFGQVPTFAGQVPDAALAGLWQQSKDLEFSDDTALDAKTKALISLAVAAQIPCSYCIWEDTMDLRKMGATDQEIGEAVAIAGLTRNWSTVFNGLQVDMSTFQKELGGM